MDAKEIKATLKNIKENLDAKDFKSAISQCKAVLKADRNNYFALVFFGVALQETEKKDEAPKAFKKAIEINPSNNLAWRGYANYYEKFESPESRMELLMAYERLIILETEPNKYGELIRKYENVAVSTQDTVYSVKLYTALGDDICDDKKLLIKQCLLNVFLSCPDTDGEIRNCKKKLFMEFALIKPSYKTHLTVCKKYLQLLLRERNLSDVISDGHKIQAYYPNEINILEYICKAYIELFCQSEDKFSDECLFKDTYSALLEVTPGSYLGLLCQGILELKTGDFVTALESFKKSIREESSFEFSWYFLCKCQIFLNQFVESEISASEVLKLFKKTTENEKIISTAELWLIQSLSEQEEEKLLKAINLGCKYFEKKTDEKEVVLPYLIKSYIKLNRISEAEKYLEVLKTNEIYLATALYLQCLILKQSGKSSEFQAELEDTVKRKPECFEAWLELGKLHYSEKNGSSCLLCLLKSAKLNQWCYMVFLHLGHCYKDLLGDLDKARRCYQKAFQLHPECPDTGLHLSDIYRILGKEDLNGQLLNLITTQKPKSKEGWVKLGSHYLSTKQYQDAVNSLRIAIRLDSNDRMTWEILADAYFYQGAYLSAGRAYAKVIDMGSDSVYPRLQCAVIKHLTGKCEDSILDFRDIVEKYPSYLPALKGHVEVCMTLMKTHASQCLNGLAMDNCQEAVNSIISCLEIRKDLSCMWKLFGDACVLLAQLPKKYCKLRVPTKLLAERKDEDGEKEVVLTKLDVLKLGSRSFCEALTLNSGSSGLWLDLAVCYNYLAVYSNSPETKKEMRGLACSAIKKSLLVNERNWESWNLFGVIAASNEIQNFPLAQHCFIRSLEETDSSPVVWTNLGTLYLCLNDLNLANQCFTEAQRIDHNYVQCWIGQAMIAQNMGHHDAMDLFRHSNQLEIHSEGGLGYANLVCRMLLETTDKTDKNYIYNIKNMNAIIVACDALTWYTDRITDNPCAFNMLGLLLERQKLYQPSCKAYQNAVSLLLSRTENRDDEYITVLDKALLNYGRSLANIGKPEEAINVLRQIQKANFVNQCALAEAYFKAKKYEEAYSSYETTLEWLAPDSGFKSHILVAMAAVVYMHQGKDDAKILLMQACQLKPPSVQGLFACCALGMLHSDLSLSELSLKELSDYRDDPKYLNHIAAFESYFYLFKGEKEKAIRVFSKAIHRHPGQPSLWLSLCLLLLHLYPSFDCGIAANCAEVTINTGRSAIDVSKVMSLVGLSDLLAGKGLRSLKSSQKAVHMFPHQTENWVVLVASVLSRCLLQETHRELAWLTKTITYIRRKLTPTKAMTRWLSNNERAVSIMQDTQVS